MTKEKSHTNGSTEYSAMRDASSVNKPDEKVYRTSFDEMDHTTKEAEEGEGDTCGWLGCRPATLERFQRPTWVLVCLCWAGAIQVSLLRCDSM